MSTLKVTNVDSKESKESTTTMSVPISTTVPSTTIGTKSATAAATQPNLADDEAFARSLMHDFESMPPARNDFFHRGPQLPWNMNTNPFIPSIGKKAARFQPYPLSDCCNPVEPATKATTKPTITEANKTLKTILKKTESDKKNHKVLLPEDEAEEEDEEEANDEEEDTEDMAALCLKLSKLSHDYINVIQSQAHTIESQQRMIHQLTEQVVQMRAEQDPSNDDDLVVGDT
jgi:hypothetical protein